MQSDCADHGKKGGPQGYAFAWDAAQGKKVLQHRLVFYRNTGYYPPVVMHSCDNPRCVNPDHLVPGDWGKNNKDRAIKGRSATVRKDLRKLDYGKATSIRAALAAGRSIRSLAKEYQVDQRSITNIRDNKTYFAGA